LISKNKPALIRVGQKHIEIGKTWNDDNLLLQASLKESEAGMDLMREMRH
jgi:hypothetical protein